MSISKIDKSNMQEVISSFPKQFSAGLAAAGNIKVSGDFKQLVFCGMGGSALPGTILKTMNNFHNWPLRIKIHRTYNLPTDVNPQSLIFIISHSGNTEETISSYIQAKENNLSMVVITSGGKLAKLCKQDNTPLVKIPKTSIQPRQAVGYQLSAIIKVLSNSKIIQGWDQEIINLSKNLSINKLEAQGKKLAKKIKGKIPIIYASNKYKALPYIWKVSFNENSKSPAFCNYFPELNHNEMEGMAHEKESKHHKQPIFHLLILQDKNSDHPRILKRMKATKDLLHKNSGLDAEFIELNKKDLLVKVFSNYILSQWTSYYLALEYETDPSPVNTVEEFKKKIK